MPQVLLQMQLSKPSDGSIHSLSEHDSMDKELLIPAHQEFRSTKDRQR